jgi:hypothetical protein
VYLGHVGRSPVARRHDPALHPDDDRRQTLHDDHGPEVEGLTAPSGALAGYGLVASFAWCA